MKRRDFTTAIATANGYHLFLEGGRPVVVRRWTTTATNAKGEKEKKYHEETLDLNAVDSWPNNVTANHVRLAFVRELKEWREWNDAMREHR